jgi:mycothiol synthase
VDVGRRATVQVKVRAPGLEDADVVAAVLNRHAAETGDHRATAEELRGWWTAPDFDPASQALVAEADDTAVGYADVGDPNGDTSQLWIDLRVPEDGRLLGADSLLLDRIMELAGSGAGAEAVFRGFGDARDDRTIDLFRERGFEVVRHGFRMTRSLDDPPPEPAWPVGIRVRTAEPETDLRPVYDAYRETFADAWGGVEEPYADFLHGWGVGEQFDPTLWFVAEDGGELAGIALCRSQR